MSQPPPLAPVPQLTPANNAKKRNASQSGITNTLQHAPPNKKYKPTPQQTMSQPKSFSTYQYPVQQYSHPHPQYQHQHQHPIQPQYQHQYQHQHQHPPNTHITHPHPSQYNMRPRKDSTKQYYDNPKRRQPQTKKLKSPSPQLETCLLSENNHTLPARILIKLHEAEEKSKQSSVNKQVTKTMIPIGQCTGLLFGAVQFQKAAVPGDISMSYTTQIDSKSGKRKPVISISNAKDTHLGQGDTKLVMVFADLLRQKRVKLTGKIIKADLDVYKKRLPPSRFVRKLLIQVDAEYDVILGMVQRTRKKVKNWKWFVKTCCLKYFESKRVEYNKLLDEIMESISNCSAVYSQNILTLEANFNAAFSADITAEDLVGIDPFEEIVTRKLLQHQRVGIEWMVLRENFHGEDDDELPPFYKEVEDKETGDIKYMNLLNDEECDDLPELGCGGILADDMGLGKTLQTIALIATNSDYQNDRENGSGPTLIVAPLTVIGNWVSQIGDHCDKNSFRIMVYHGPNREKDLEVISSYNIVITTYDIVALEFCDENDENREEMRKHYGCGLQYVNWLRVVLDEAHKIRSRKTRVFKACNALVSKSRWCLTGTPVQNRLDDLYSLFCFLKLQPIADKLFWNKFIIQPLKNGSSLGFDRLRQIMKQLCLRRDKGMKIGGKPIISIPDKIVRQRILEFIPSEKDKYGELMAIHKAAFNRMRQRGDKEIMRNFSSVLSMLLRLRQCCAHPLLVPELNGTNSIANINLNISAVEDANQECASCGQTPDCATLTVCNHVYCKDCFLYELEIHNGSFPCTLCGDKLTKSSISETKEQQQEQEDQPVEEEEEEEEKTEKKKKKKYKKFVVPTDRKIEPSTKMQALISDIKSWDGSEVGGLPNKAVVFSQWTSVLDILAVCLDAEDILYERLDGTMSRSTREAAMDNFRQQLDIPVFLMSLKAGNLGVNMTVANHVYMLDPWWNPATEDQAVDRVYRLGQKRNVNVNHFVIKDSVEEKILKIQLRKRKLISSALGQSKEDMKQERKKEWLNDLKELFTAK